MVLFHCASGGLAGLASGSRAGALLLGPVVHVAADAVPHRDVGSLGFELGSGIACLAVLALRRGPLDPATLGAAASSAPDLEHIFPRLRPRGRKLFHRAASHEPPAGGGVPVRSQLVVALAALVWLVRKV